MFSQYIENNGILIFPKNTDPLENASAFSSVSVASDEPNHEDATIQNAIISLSNEQKDLIDKILYPYKLSHNNENNKPIRKEIQHVIAGIIEITKDFPFPKCALEDSNADNLYKLAHNILFWATESGHSGLQEWAIATFVKIAREQQQQQQQQQEKLKVELSKGNELDGGIFNGLAQLLGNISDSLSRHKKALETHEPNSLASTALKSMVLDMYENYPYNYMIEHNFLSFTHLVEKLSETLTAIRSEAKLSPLLSDETFLLLKEQAELLRQSLETVATTKLTESQESNVEKIQQFLPLFKPVARSLPCEDTQQKITLLINLPKTDALNRLLTNLNNHTPSAQSQTLKNQVKELTLRTQEKLFNSFGSKEEIDKIMNRFSAGLAKALLHHRAQYQQTWTRRILDPFNSTYFGETDKIVTEALCKLSPTKEAVLRHIHKLEKKETLSKADKISITKQIISAKSSLEGNKSERIALLTQEIRSTATEKTSLCFFNSNASQPSKYEPSPSVS